jgi:GH35 family endo-1,4-beta-xylanase
MTATERLAAVWMLAWAGHAWAAETLPGRSAPLTEEPAVGVLRADPTATGITEEAFVPEAEGRTAARRFVISEPGPHPWSQEANLSFTKPIRKGDVCLIRFWVRGKAPHDESGEARFVVYAQKQGPPWDKSVEITQSAAAGWRRIDIPFAWKADYAPGEASLGFGLGMQEQEVEIADLTILRFDAPVTVEDLPSTVSGYAGRAPDAAWRAAAAERIREHRMAPLTVKVVDGQGKPVRGAQVKVRMQRHAFQFGTALQLWRWSHEGREAEQYRERFFELFNAASAENALKWPAWDGQWVPDFDRERTLAALRWLRERDIHVRGHVLVWPAWEHLPDTIRALRATPDRIPPAIAAHLEDILTTTGDLVSEWDVINEPYTSTDLEDLLGRGIFVDWFKQARRLRPDAGLYLNDFAILSAGGLDRAHQDHFKATAEYLLQAGAPITGLGLQGHIGGTMTPPERVLRILDRLAVTGLDLRVTEFDVDTLDEQLKADYTRDFLTAVFSHPSVVGFQLWGFWAKAHWKPNAAWFGVDWSPRPVVEAYRRLVFEDWWTEADVRSDHEGMASVRGFLGNYLLTVSARGESTETTCTLTGEGETAEVVLAP